MPIRSSLIEPQVILQEFVGNVSLQDMHDGVVAMTALVDQSEVSHFATIIDGTQMKHLELDIRALIRAAGNDDREIALYIITPYGKLAAQILAPVISKHIKVCASREEALRLARQRLEAVNPLPKDT